MIRRLSAVLCACSLLSICGACIDKAIANPLEPRPAPAVGFVGLALDDASLEERGARIGRIEIEIDDVFERTTALAAPYRVANGLHIPTRRSAVLAQVLFRSGEIYSRRVLDETARLLRASRYLGDAVVEPLRYQEEDNTVDVLVRVHDVWTMSPGLSFGRKGGKNSTKLKFEDANFLGLGKQVAVARSDDADRSAWRFGYADPNLLGTRWRLAAERAALSDGAESSLQLGRPFYSLDARWAFESSAYDGDVAISRYRRGEIVEQLAMRERQFDLSAGWSAGLRDGWARRTLAGVRYDKREFSVHGDYQDALAPDDRVLAYPWVGVELIEDGYATARNLDQIGRTEDVHVGRSARLEVGLAGSAFGGSREALILNGALRAAVQPDDEQRLISAAEFSTRLEGGGLRNAQLDLSSRYYLRRSPRTVFFAAASATLGARLDEERQLLLGAEEGLRGYPLRYQAGGARAVFTLEERVYTHWQPLKLFNVGAAIFADAGRAWGRDKFAGPPLGWLADVGVGLRLGSARSALGNVLHIDLAMPLTGGQDIQAVQLLIETRRSF